MSASTMQVIATSAAAQGAAAGQADAVASLPVDASEAAAKAHSTIPTDVAAAAPSLSAVAANPSAHVAESTGAVAQATTASPAKPATGVTFPVRPATTATAQTPSPAVGHASAADAGSIGGALFSLVLVVGLILALGWLAKRMPGMQRGAGTTNLKVVASVALGPRDRAVVVDVGGTQLLLGVGQGGVRALHTLDAPLPVADAAATPSPFAQVLSQHFGRKP